MSKQLDIYLAVQRANIYAPELSDLEKATQIGQSFQIETVDDLIKEYKIGKKEWERNQAFHRDRTTRESEGW